MGALRAGVVVTRDRSGLPRRPPPFVELFAAITCLAAIALGIGFLVVDGWSTLALLTITGHCGWLARLIIGFTEGD